MDVIERQLEQYAKYDDKLQRARFLLELGRYRDAALDYVEGIAESLREPRLFGAAFYLKELAESQIITELFVEALGEAAARNDLWWQVRALQELGWHKELADLLLRHETDITSGSNLMLRILLADAKGDEALADDLRKQLARGSHVVIVTDDKEDEPEPGARSA